MDNIKSRPAIFLDRDGVLCEYKEEIITLEDFNLREDIGPAIAKLNQAGFWVFVVTNQPQIAKGKLTVSQLDAQHQKLAKHLENFGAHIDKIFYCPHRVNGQLKELAFDCDCRKPKPGLIFKAQQEFAITTPKSFMIGDTWRDAECAKNAGVKFFGLSGGGGYPYADDTEEAAKAKPIKIFANLALAVDFILTTVLGTVLE
jgi:D-glycero-D-manno-heptose 1,7-bisphosphate phosphatase